MVPYLRSLALSPSFSALSTHPFQGYSKPGAFGTNALMSSGGPVMFAAAGLPVLANPLVAPGFGPLG